METIAELHPNPLKEKRRFVIWRCQPMGSGHGHGLDEVVVPELPDPRGGGAEILVAELHHRRAAVRERPPARQEPLLCPGGPNVERAFRATEGRPATVLI